MGVDSTLKTCLADFGSTFSRFTKRRLHFLSPLKVFYSGASPQIERGLYPDLVWLLWRESGMEKTTVKHGELMWLGPFLKCNFLNKWSGDSFMKQFYYNYYYWSKSVSYTCILLFFLGKLLAKYATDSLFIFGVEFFFGVFFGVVCIPPLNMSMEWLSCPKASQTSIFSIRISY